MSKWVGVADGMPESGICVIAFFVNEFGKHRTIRAQYAAQYSLEQADECDGGEYSEDDDTFYCDEGWYESNEFENVHWAVDGDISHWMPLPDPPAALHTEATEDCET